MSLNGNNFSNFVEPSKIMDSTTAPSLTDTSLNTAFKGKHVKVGSDIYYVDDTGRAELIYGVTASPDFAQTVYVNATSPTTATIFDLNNPPTTNDNTLKADSNNIYIGTDGSTWTYNTSTSTYSTYVYPTTTPYMVTAYSNVNDSLPGSFVNQINKYNLISTAECLGGANTAFNTTTYRFTPTRAGWYEVNVLYDIYRSDTAQTQIILRKNGANILSNGGIGAITAQIVRNIYMNGTTDYLDAVNLGPVASTRKQFFQTSLFQARWLHN